ncbi:MAG: hypothetical protein RBS80_18325 [Thermoguttaceae bacterium]|jgi:hypothetical protein|nr:hypothetical protein [Thermoguttaceae bacterium]
MSQSVPLRNISVAVALGILFAIGAVMVGIVIGLLTSALLGHTFRGYWAVNAGLMHACLLALGGVFLAVRIAAADNARRGAVCGGAIFAAVWLMISAFIVSAGGRPDMTVNWWMAALGVLGLVYGALGGVACRISWPGNLTAVISWLAMAYVCADLGSLAGGANLSAVQIVARRLRGEIEGTPGISFDNGPTVVQATSIGAACGGALALAIALAASARGLSLRNLPLGRLHGGPTVTLGDALDRAAARLARAIGDACRPIWNSRWRVPLLLISLATVTAALAMTVQHAAAKRQVIAQEQREAAAALEELGAKLLHGRGGVTVVDLENSQVTDADLALLVRFPRLENLNLHQTGITSDGLVHLRPLKTLQRLGVDSDQVTEDSVEHLRCLTNLRAIYGYGQHNPYLDELRREFFWIRN